MGNRNTSRVQIIAEGEGAPGATFMLIVQGETLPCRMSVATLQELSLQAKWALEAHRFAQSRLS